MLDHGRPYLLGESMTVADAYMFVVLNWSDVIGFELEPWPHVSAFMGRMRERPSVRSAMTQEGLLKGAA